jgi:hypothetical protein
VTDTPIVQVPEQTRALVAEVPYSAPSLRGVRYALAATVTPTQVRRPWRSTIRTVFQALLGLAVILPIMVQTAGLDPATIPWLAGVLAIAAAVTRLMAVPAVEGWLRRFVPFLAAAPDPASETKDEGGYGAVELLVVVILVIVVIAILARVL